MTARVEDRLEALIAPVAGDLGFDIVRIRLSGEKRRRLQVMIERRDGGPMVVDDCAKISRAVSPVLDMEDPVSGAYSLEVSSPGIDRPLVKLEDFERFKTYKALIETTDLIDGRRKFRGRLAGVESGGVKLEMNGATIKLPFDGIRRAKLELTDELIAATKYLSLKDKKR
jgi:ribosome maturation factor RimP